jgi:hypothetical protein
MLGILLGSIKIILKDKLLENWNLGNWFLHHDNEPAHSALSVPEFLAENKMTVIPHTPLSPDSVLCDFFLFPYLKMGLK